MKNMMLTMLLVWLVAMPTQARQPDEYWNSPRGTYEERRALFLDYYSENGADTLFTVSSARQRVPLPVVLWRWTR
ncbi:hypothetical protein [Bacteroides stercorirosoris]|uniref:hypothetical protein n=1 Tax=Bacteroides stercorirosoris TaxID=871324 RepID=UPI000ACFB078|nr:hypothetical protein [Bacteroides stercorirosoris]